MLDPLSHSHAVADKGYGLGRDPTGTTKLRASFRAQAKLRLRLIRAAMRQSVGEHDLLGLASEGPLAHHAPAVTLAAFNHRLSMAVQQQLGSDWVRPYLLQAWDRGLAAAAGEVSAPPGHLPPDRELELARAELQGIGAALVQGVTRTAALLQARRQRRWRVLRKLLREFDRLAVPRVVAFTNTAVVGAYNRAKLEVYRRAGVTHVGIIPETQPRSQDGLTVDQVLVGIATAGDDAVCEECQDYSDGSPYPTDDVEIPLHPNCRCTTFPWDEDVGVRAAAAAGLGIAAGIAAGAAFAAARAGRPAAPEEVEEREEPIEAGPDYAAEEQAHRRRAERQERLMARETDPAKVAARHQAAEAYRAAAEAYARGDITMATLLAAEAADLADRAK